jgi:hypothetical protein
MGSTMTNARREDLMGVLKKVCLDPVMDKAYQEAEARLRKNPKFIEFKKVVDAVLKVDEKLSAAKAKLERELEEVEWFFDEAGLSTPSISAYITNDINRIEIKREERQVRVEVGSNRGYSSKSDLDIVEPVDMAASKALVMANEAIDLAKLCTKEVELIALIRETKEKIAGIKPEPKKKKK